jgi:DNA (cytosine-5)-methyltransferase 1
MVNHINYIDLFAGCGGISLGLYNAGLNGLFAIEKNPDAFNTLKHNLIHNLGHFEWPDWLQMKNYEIEELLSEKENELKKLQGSVDLIVGGPPCQGFSIAGRRNETDERNQLIHSYLKFVELIKPRIIMFENVHGFTFKFSSTNDSSIAYSDEVLSLLKNKLGYSDARGETIDMSQFGIPQYRKRYIVIASQENLTDAIFDELFQARSIFANNKGITKTISVKEAISDLEFKHGVIDCPDTNGFVSGIVSNPKNSYQKLLQKQNTNNYCPDSHRFVNHAPNTVDTFTRLLNEAPRNKRLFGEDQKIYNFKKRSVTILDPNKPSRTITTIPDDYIHYSEPRVMTVRECARIQTFPDWFEFKGPYTTGGKCRTQQTPRYTQVGNAVPPLFSEQIGLAIKKVLHYG